MLRSKLDGEVSREMQGSGFGGGVAEGSLFAERADANTGDGGGYDYAGGIVESGAFAEERGESGGKVSVS